MVYAGKKTYTDANEAKITNICRQIYDQVGAKPGYSWTHDSLFTTLQCLDMATLKKMLACGTIEDNMKCLPMILKHPAFKKRLDNLERGEWIMLVCGNITLVYLKDSKLVKLIDNGLNRDLLVPLTRRIGSELKTFTVPLSPKHYNDNKCEVDTGNQHAATVKVHKKNSSKKFNRNWNGFVSKIWFEQSGTYIS